MATDFTDYTLQLQCTALAHNGPQCPTARSAHNCVLGPDQALWLTAGDSGTAGHRAGDVWRLQGADPTWQQVVPCTYQQQQQGQTQQHQQQQQCQRGCTARSNATAVSVGDWLLLFGGWDATGLHPLAQLEAFSFSTHTWHTPTPAGQAPSPRGQPTGAVNTACTAVYFFGGWDGKVRYNDLYKLSLGQHSDSNTWAWERVQPQKAPPKGARAGTTFEQQQQALLQQQQQQTPPAGHQQQQVAVPQQQQQQPVPVPCARADHSMVCWHYCDDGTWKDLLVVFGGSSSQGLLNDTWLFDINTSSWTQAYYGGAAPCPRSSCAAAITGDILMLHGGQTPGGVLQDMHLLNLATLTWLQVDLGPVVQPLCRHSMVVSGSSCLIFGGYDGCSASDQLLSVDLRPVQQLQRSSLADLVRSMACCCGTAHSQDLGSNAQEAPGGSSKAGVVVLLPDTAAALDNEAANATEQDSSSALKAVRVAPPAAVLQVPPVVKALSKKASPPPLKLIDLPNAQEVAGMPQWKQVRQLHQAAVAAGCDTYIDPSSGYTVFTSKYLQQRQCCGNKCRHCPHGWVNVAQQRLQPQAPAPAAASAGQQAAALDW